MAEIAELLIPGRRTKRRFAHELYPHADECEIRSMAIEVPYLYARAMGLEVEGTGWFDHPGTESMDRTIHLVNARLIAFQSDALLQGMTGEDAWRWVAMRANDETGEWAWERAVHYGVDPLQIKPYACGPARAFHSHLGDPDAYGSRVVTRIPGTEDACIECTEPIETNTAPAEEKSN